MPQDHTQLFGLPSPGLEQADAILLPLPIEKTVCYGKGTAGGPRAIIEASPQVETFDEETCVEFATGPKIHALPPFAPEGDLEQCLAAVENHVRSLPKKFLLTLGGEHSVTYGVVTGLAAPAGRLTPDRCDVERREASEDLAGVTIVHVDAHADLADRLLGRYWSHGTVMRRLWERGCRLVQVGIRSLTSEEHQVATKGPRITTYYAHRLAEQWTDVIETLRRLEGNVYLSIDVDGLDPSIIPSTGTPQPDGLSWRQTMQVIRTVMVESHARLIGADIVEFVPSPVPPGCDPMAARLTTKLLAWWWTGVLKRRDAARS